MARAKGKDSYFAIEDSAASTLRNISIYVDSVEISHDTDMLDITTQGAEARAFDSGLTNCTITVGGIWDDTASTGSWTVFKSLLGLETTVGFEYGPEGNTAAMEKWSGEVFVANYSESAPVADMVRWTAQLQVSGAITFGTFS